MKNQTSCNATTFRRAVNSDGWRRTQSSHLASLKKIRLNVVHRFSLPSPCLTCEPVLTAYKHVHLGNDSLIASCEHLYFKHRSCLMVSMLARMSRSSENALNSRSMSLTPSKLGWKPYFGIVLFCTARTSSCRALLNPIDP